MFRLKNKRFLNESNIKTACEKVNCDISTVSRVVNNKPNRVSKDTREKILKTAQEMEYIPNLNASNLASGKTRTIGVLVFNISDNVYAEYIESIDRYLSLKDYSIIPFITYGDPAKERQRLTALQSHQVDAMICMEYNPLNEKFYRALQRKAMLLFSEQMLRKIILTLIQHRLTSAAAITTWQSI